MKPALLTLLLAPLAHAEPPISAPASAAIPASASGAASLPADAPTQAPYTLVFKDGGRCENAAAAKAEDQLLAEARVQKAAVLTTVGVIGLAVGLAVGVFVVAPLTKK